MFNPPGNQGHSLGLSVGATNLAATRDGQTAAIRPAELTVQGQRLTGFVDRVGDPVPLIAPDGSKHRSEELLADALGAIAHAVTAGAPVADVAVSVPAHWRASVIDTLRRNLRGKTAVISDATAALTALRANPGLPTHGVIVLCDFGGSGTSITLANAAREFSPFGETVRFPDFSGDHIDQALLTHVVTGLVDGSQTDPSGTAMVGSLTRLRDECRRAKERLSAETATAVAVDLPSQRADIRITRTELEDLMAAPLSEFLAVLDETLERYGVPAASVSAVATVGGGARIPLIIQRLSERLRAPVVTTPHPQLTAAEGAALIAQRSRVVDEATALTPTAPAGVAATTTIAAADESTTLAWSEDDVTEEVLPYSGAPYSDVADSRPEVNFRHEEWQDEAPPRRSPLVLFGLSAVAAAIAAAVFGITLVNDTTTTPVEAATSVSTVPTPAASAPLPVPPAPQAPKVTAVVVQQPAKRFYPAPQPQAPVTQQPPAPVTTEPPTTTEPTPPPWTPPPWTPPTWTPPWKLPTTPPVDPGTGTGGTDTGSLPADPGTGGTGTPPVDTGTGTSTGGGGTTGTPKV
ncbi:MAG TPA: Hsp70 family protein [Mycobacterium sp.]|nr:Hsp70 family protein [Mycobacterium sp.]